MPFEFAFPEVTVSLLIRLMMRQYEMVYLKYWVSLLILISKGNGFLNTNKDLYSISINVKLRRNF
jgi:hypothetical protein